MPVPRLLSHNLARHPFRCRSQRPAPLPLQSCPRWIPLHHLLRLHRGQARPAIPSAACPRKAALAATCLVLTTPQSWCPTLCSRFLPRVPSSAHLLCKAPQSQAIPVPPLLMFSLLRLKWWAALWPSRSHPKYLYLPLRRSRRRQTRLVTLCSASIRPCWGCPIGRLRATTSICWLPAKFWKAHRPSR